MEWADYWERADIVDEQHADAVRRDMQIAAFVGWQMGSGQKKPYKKYLEKLGLSDEPNRRKPTSRDLDVNRKPVKQMLAEFDAFRKARHHA